MDINSLEEYVALIVDATVGVGIRPQLEALRAGFSQVNTPTSLHVHCNVVRVLNCAVEEAVFLFCSKIRFFNSVLLSLRC